MTSPQPGGPLADYPPRTRHHDNAGRSALEIAREEIEDQREALTLLADR